VTQGYPGLAVMLHVGAFKASMCPHKASIKAVKMFTFFEVCAVD